MRLFPNVRTLLLGGTAVGLLAGCTQADLDDVASPGSGTPVVINPIVNPGGSAAGAAAFAARATAPASAADCPAGTSFESGVPIGGGISTNFCSLTDIAPAVSTAATGDQIITGNVNIPFSPDPILISGTVFVGDPSGPASTLTVAPGQVFVSRSAEGVVDLLVVSRGSRMIANGTASQPIVFTSLEDYLDDLLPNGTSGVGDWGGLAINGRAPLNQCTVDASAVRGTDACLQTGEGGSGVFGGGDINDSSGSFRFVRVQHAGFQFTPTNELNGIALQGVGRGTVFENIQVHRGADDGFEWFGGSVNARNLVVTGANDDSFDWTDGWIGRAQFLIAVQQPGDDNGVEGDNNDVGTATGAGTQPPGADSTPRSDAILANFTLIGDGSSGEGVQLREGTAGGIVNGIIANFAEGFEFNPEGTGPNPIVNSVLLLNNGSNFTAGAQALFNAGTNNFALATSTLNGVFPGGQELNAVAFNATTLDPFFQTANFVGALGPNATPTSNFTAGWTIPGSIPGSVPTTCPAGTTLAPETPTTAGFTGRFEQIICVINGTPVSANGVTSNFILGNVRLVSGILYRLDGTLFIGQDAGPNPAAPASAAASLTIDPGVTIYGNQAPGVVDLLVVSRGSDLFVNGTPVAPVVLTSRADLVNGGAIRASATGEIGGLAINGRGPLNQCTVDASAVRGSVNCQQTGEGGSGLFGGATPDDDSGSVSYLQIRYAGFQFTPTNELNSIALQGVGNGTDLDFIQIINGADDGIEWFGGTVNASNVVVTGANDDAIDWTDGWTGTLQYSYVQQGNGFIVGDNGIEGDGNDVGTATGLPAGVAGADSNPRSRAVIANVTLVGDGSSGEGIQLREGTAGAVVNAIVTNFAEAIEFNDEGTGQDPILAAVALFNNTSNFTAQAQTIFDAGPGNQILSALSFTVPTGLTRPIFPSTVTPAVTAQNPVTICGTVFGPTSGVEAGVPNPCSALDPATFLGALQSASDTRFVGWTDGL